MLAKFTPRFYAPAEAMTPDSWIALPRRGVAALAGDDARPFLQGLVTCDVDRVSPSRAVYGALLTPQGRFLHDFFVVERDGALLLDCDAGRLPDLLRRLDMYRLRAKVGIDDLGGAFRVVALPPAPGEEGDAAAWLGGVVFVDPRLRALGRRAVVPAEGLEAALARAGLREDGHGRYEERRIALGVPDGGADLAPGKAFPLEGGLDVLGGVSFEKGCYVGQEVTARMKHRGLVKRRLVPVAFDGPPPPPGTPVASGGAAAGEVRSGVGGRALAMLRLDLLEAGGLAAGGVALTAGTPPG